MERIRWYLAYMPVGKQRLHLSTVLIDLEQTLFWIWWSLVVLVPLLLQRPASLVSVSVCLTIMEVFMICYLLYELLLTSNSEGKTETIIC